MDQFVVTILDLDVPFAFGLVPRCTVDGTFVFDVLVAVVFLGNIMHVRVYLLRGGVVIGPLRVRWKAESIVVSWNIAFALRSVRTVRLRNMNQVALPQVIYLVSVSVYVCFSIFNDSDF